MKYLSVALISALVFATVAVAAPSTPQKSSAEDFSIVQVLKKYFKNVPCIRDVVNEVVERNHENYTIETVRFNKIADMHTNICLEFEDSWKKEECMSKTTVDSFQVFLEFFTLLFRESRLHIIDELYSEITSQCLTSDDDTVEKFFDVIEDISRTTEGSKGAEHLKCIADAITAAVKETDFAGVWNEYKKDLEDAFERIKACKQEENKWAAAKCVHKEVSNSYQIFAKFAKNLKKANRETYKRIRQYIKDRCY